MDTSVVVARVDNVFFQAPLAEAAASLGWRPLFIDDALRRRYPSAPGASADGFDVVALLVAEHPCLIVLALDPANAGWEALAAEAKTDPATRKIPILAFGSHTDAALHARARAAGCDTTMSNGAFKANMVGALRKHARTIGTDELIRQSGLPLPEDARLAVELFNSGEYFEQHEHFEAAWRAEAGPVRQLYQGLLQVGVAFLQIERRNYEGARKLFQRSRQYLAALPDVCQGVDVARFRAEAETAAVALERLGAEGIVGFDRALFCRIHLG